MDRNGSSYMLFNSVIDEEGIVLQTCRGKIDRLDRSET